jgi:hypothetical protein
MAGFIRQSLLYTVFGMNDLMSSEADQDSAAESRASGGPAVRILLWVLLVVFSAINLTANTVEGWSMLAGLPSAIVVVGCAAALVAHHVKQRRR